MHHRLPAIICPCRLPDVIGILRKARRINLTEIGILCMVGCRLANIVKTGPEKLAHGKGRISVYRNAVLHGSCSPAGNTVSKGRALLIILRQDPCLQREVIYTPALNDRGGFASVNHPIRVLLMMLLIILFGIIIACQLDQIRTFLCILPGHIIGPDGDSGISSRIIGFHQRLQLPGDLLPVFIHMGVVDLISDAPHDHTGVISVTAHPTLYISFMPLLEKSCIIIVSLGAFPHVKGL